MNRLELQPHTIIMTIGPSNCGKSFFCQNLLIPFLNNRRVSYKYLSPDEIFSADDHTQYPVNTDIVIVDAMHLSKQGRKNIISLAEKNHYAVVAILFDYRNREDYFRYADEYTNRELITGTLRTFREKTLQELEKDVFEQIYRIPAIDFSDVSFSLPEKDKRCEIKGAERICYIGDIHGCLDEFLTCMLDDKGLEYDRQSNKLRITDEAKYHIHILVGDYIDKGPKIRETIEFLYDNTGFFKIVRGNHEYWVYEYMKGRIRKDETNSRLMSKWFNTALILQQDPVLADKFYHLFERSYDFIVTDHSIVTHSPCENKYLGKTDRVSTRKQRNRMYPKPADFVTEEEYLESKDRHFQFLLTEADKILPAHLFGHTMLKEVFSYKNKVCLDTGCVAGGALSVALYSAGQRELSFRRYESLQPKTVALGSYFRNRASEPGAAVQQEGKTDPGDVKQVPGI